MNRFFFGRFPELSTIDEVESPFGPRVKYRSEKPLPISLCTFGFDPRDDRLLWRNENGANENDSERTNESFHLYLAIGTEFLH